MIYLSKYQHHPAPQAVETKESPSVGPERNCGRIEEVFRKKNLLEKISLIKKEDRFYSAAKQPLNLAIRGWDRSFKVFSCLIIFFLFFGSSSIFAQRFAVANGNWDGAIWATTAGGVAGSAATPTSSDAVTINVGIAVTVNVPASCLSLTFTLATASNSVTISGTNSLSVTNLISMSRPSGASFSTTLAVGAGTLTAGSLTMSATGAGRNDIISISTGGTVTVTGNISSGGLGSQIIFSGAGTLNAGGTFMSGTPGTFTASTGKINYTGASANLGSLAYTYYDLQFSGTGTSTASATVVVQHDLTNTGGGTLGFGSQTVTLNGTNTQSIAGFTTTGLISVTKTAGTATFQGVVNGGALTISSSGGTLNLGTGLTHTISGTPGTLTLEGNVQLSGSWGGTGSGATYINSTYFAAVTGILNVASCPGVWIGVTTDWNTASNWCDGAVPTASTNVTIPSGGNQPVIGAAAVCNDIIVNSGATLTITGSNTLTVSGNWTNSGTFTANSSTVIYNAAGVQTGAVVTYNNLTLSGSGAKTFATTPTVNGILSMEGTATVTVSSGAVTYGTNATLQYNTATARNTKSDEWLNTFLATGGVIIANTGEITLNVNKTLNVSVPLTINSGAILATNNRQLTFEGDFINSGGTFTAGSSPIVIAGTATQSIAGFTTTGTVSITKTGGIATFTGIVNGGAFTISTGAEGTLNLGTGLTHTISGTPGTLTLGGYGQPSGSWGGTGSAATYINTTYFAPATGILNVATSSCTAGYWIGGISTDWNTASNWCDGAVPIASTDVVIPSGGNQPVIGVAAVCNNITINSGATLTITGSNTLTVSGNWTNSGTFTANSSTVIFNSADQTVGTGPYNNLTLSTSGTKTLGAATIINGNLTIDPSVTLATGNLGLTFGGNFVNNGTLTAGSSPIVIAGTADQSIAGFTTTGLVSMTKTGGTATFQNDVNGAGFTIDGAGGTLNLGTGLTHTFTGKVTLTAGTLDGGSSILNENATSTTAWGGTGAQFNAGTSTVNFGGADQTLSSTTATTFYNLTLSASGTKTLKAATTINGNLTINTGVTLAIGNFGLTFGGNFVNNGTLTVGSFPIVIAGTADQSIAGFTTTDLVSMTKTGGTAIFQGNVNGAGLTINGAGTLNLGAGLTHTFTGIVTLTAGTLDGGSSTLNENKTSTSAWNGTGSVFNAGTSTVNFGGVNQILSATATTFYNLILSNSGTKTLGAATTINENLSITGTAIANLGIFTSFSKTLTLGGNGQPSGLWGGAGSGATYINATYFAAVAGKLDVNSSSYADGSWIGETSTDWHTASNWFGAVFPISSTNVVISPGSTYQPEIGAAAVCNNITINSGATLTITDLNTLTVSGNWMNSGTFTANSSTVIFNGADQTVRTGPFNNLTLSTSGTKTLAAATIINGNLTIDPNVTLATGNFGLTFGGNFVNNGTLTAGSSPIVIAGTAYQSIVGFTTTGSVSMTKTLGTATFQSSVSGAGFTINGAGGTLNLGAGLTHTFSANWVRTAGTLDGGSSLLRFMGAATGASGVTFTFTAGIGTVDYNRSGNQTIPALNYYNLILSGSGVRTLASSGTIGVTGTFTLGGTNTYTVTGSTVNFNGAGDQTVTLFPYNNLILSNSGTKTFTAATTINGDLSISGTAIADLGTYTSSAYTMSLGGAGVIDGTWGSTGSSATYKNDTYFAATTGIITVGTSSCTAPTITLGSDPTVCIGTTTANLTYSATTGTPDKYSIVFDAAALTAGFANVTDVTLGATPIAITVLEAPVGGAGTFNATLTVKYAATGCVSSGSAITVTVIPLINASLSNQTSEPDCPDFLTPFNANNDAYNAGSTLVVFRVTRVNSSSAWNFDYTISGGTVNGASPETAPGNKSVGAGTNYFDMNFYISNTPGSSQTIVFTVTNIQDSNCTSTGVNQSVSHLISAMPVIGSFN